MKNKFFEKIDKKKLIIVISIVLFLLLFVILIMITKDKEEVTNPPKIDVSKIKGVYVSEERTYYSDSVFLSGKKLAKENCYKKVCVSDLEIVCTENSGEIDYVLQNKSKSKQSIYLKIVVGKYNGYVIRENVNPGEKVNGHIGYSGYDLRKTKSYKLKPMTDEEKKAIVNK